MKRFLIVLLFLFSFDTLSQTAEEFFYRAVDKYEKEEYQAAIDLYTSAINLEPKNPLLYYNRCHTKQTIKDYNGAVSDCSKCIELDPNYGSAYYVRGYSKQSINDFAGAISDFKKASEDDLIPYWSDVKNLIKNDTWGYLYYYMGLTYVNYSFQYNKKDANSMKRIGCNYLDVAKRFGNQAAATNKKVICSKFYNGSFR